MGESGGWWFFPTTSMYDMIYYFSKGQAINPNEGLPYMDGLGSFGMAVRPMVEILDGSQITQND